MAHCFLIPGVRRRRTVSGTCVQTRRFDCGSGSRSTPGTYSQCTSWSKGSFRLNERKAKLFFDIFTARKRSLRRLCFYRCVSIQGGGCVAKGGAWWRGTCVAKGGMHGEGGHAWQGGHVWWRGACMVKGGVCGEGGFAWQGACMTGGCVWQGGVHGRGHAWQRGACMVGGMHVTHTPSMHILRLQHMVN